MLSFETNNNGKSNERAATVTSKNVCNLCQIRNNANEF